MNIGFSTPVIQRGQTGIAQYVFGLLRGFIPYTEQHRFTLFVLEEDLPLFEFAQKHMDIVLVPERFRSPVKSILWHQTHLPRLVRQHRIDLLHVPSYRRLCWQQPCALVATIHDLAAFHVARKYDWKRMFYGRYVARHLARRQHEIIAISRNTARDILQFFRVPSERITIIHNGVDHTQFYSGPREESARLLEKHHGIDQPFFLYVARLEHPAKNHVRLIEAFNRFKTATKSPWKLVLAGSDWHGADVIHAAIQQSRFAKDIHALGFVSSAELPLLYRAAEVFVYPSLYEGFGMPPLEAMACGCPVISSTRGSLWEVVGEAAETIDPESVGQLTAAMGRLSCDSLARERLRAAGLAHAHWFNWQRAAEATLKVYYRAVAKTNLLSANTVPLARAAML